jgi:hypothetical protein
MLEVWREQMPAAALFVAWGLADCLECTGS